MSRPSAAVARAQRRRLLVWFDRHGRKNLPWQKSRNPYRLWVSEIMLQQTQVVTVIPYYERFLKRFPDIATLARARLDSVLHRWTGLGYYARARNLKKAAEKIQREHNGRFPRDIEQVADLPGIGRSTAGAILAFAFDQRHPILDGNVKRVLARLHAIDSPLTTRETEQQLWQLAELYTPKARVADYTQAIMDLGATLCTPRKPQCPRCPLARNCAAHALGTPESFPVRKAGKKLPIRKTVMLMIRDARGRVLLTQRPPSGLWGGLWSFPECANRREARNFCRDALGLDVSIAKPWPLLHHSFSHFRLHITPLPARVVGTATILPEVAPAAWIDPEKSAARGLSTPVKKLLTHL